MSRAGSDALNAAPGESTPGLQTLYGVDRLTGMAALLHRFPEDRAAPMLPPALPESSALLPVTEMDDWDGQLYAVTELPHTAALATHPGEVAVGVLEALSVLHRAGMTHGGVGLAQFWQVGSAVQLAGAGLPWQEHATPEDDMRGLAAALDALGGRPASLRQLEQLTAGEALDALRRQPTTRQEPAAQVAAPPAEVVPSARQETPATVVTDTPDLVIAPVSASTQPAAPVQLESKPVVSEPVSSPLPTEQAAPVEVPLPSPTPYRSASDIIVIGAALPTDAPSTADEPGQPLAPRLVPDPIRIGFDEVGSPSPSPVLSNAEVGQPVTVPLLDWDSESTFEEGTAETELTERSRADKDTVQPQPIAEQPAPVSPLSPVTPLPAAPIPIPIPINSLRNQPVRIGWEEDNSWRVVKPLSERPAVPPRSRVPLWALIALIVLVLAGGVWLALSRQSSHTAAACCSVAFKVQGVSNVPVKITVVQSPSGSPLGVGALVGTAPGTLKFPDVSGQYRLRFEAKGHAAMMANLNVPTGSPFVIVLK